MKKYFTILVLFLVHNFAFCQWTEVTSSPYSGDHTFGFSIDDVGYIMTGNVDFGVAVASFYSYSAENDEWTQLPDFPGGGRGFGIGDVWNEKAYFGFGRNPETGQAKNDLWEFDPITEEWTELAACPCSVRLHPALVSHEGKIYVGMGSNQGENLKDWWQYDIATDTWTEKSEFPSFGRHHPFQFAVGDYVYAGFGHGTEFPFVYKDWYRYDPVEDSWLKMNDMPGQARVAGTQFSHNGFGYVLSGQGEDHGNMDSGEFWKYDAELDSWEELTAHPGVYSRWAPASFIINNEVYLINGLGLIEYQDEVFKYSLEEATNVQDLEESSTIDVYPNPFDNKIAVRFSENLFTPGKVFHAKIYDVTGTKRHDAVFDVINPEFDLESLESGIYIFELYEDNLRIERKKIIKR